MKLIERRKREADLVERLDAVEARLEALAAATPARALESAKARFDRVLATEEVEDALELLPDLEREVARIADVVAFPRYARVLRTLDARLEASLVLTDPAMRDTVALVQGPLAATAATLSAHRAARADADALQREVDELGERAEGMADEADEVAFEELREAFLVPWRALARHAAALAADVAAARSALLRSEGDLADAAAAWRAARGSLDRRATSLARDLAALAMQSRLLLNDGAQESAERAARALAVVLRARGSPRERERRALEVARAILAHDAPEVRERLAAAAVRLAHGRLPA